MKALYRKIYNDFLEDVKDHELKISLDQGAHRHLTFKQNNSYNMHYHITTWPGYLCISGDMGCFVFSRMHDMFEFFRGINTQEGVPGVPFSYWAEKLDATDNRSRTGILEDNVDAYKQMLLETYLRDIREGNFSVYASNNVDARAGRRRGYEEIKELCKEIEECPGTESRVTLIYNFSSSNGYSFDEFPYKSCQNYTFHFIWCCFAIVKAIEEYDKLQSAQAA